MSVEKWTKTNHTGIYTRGGMYKVRATRTLESGKRLQREVTLPEGTTLEKAEAALSELRAQLDPVGAKPITTVGDYGIEWLTLKSKRLRASTLRGYELSIVDHVLPVLGHIDIRALRRSDIEAWVVEAEAKVMPSGEAYSRATVQGWWRVLRIMLRDAVVDLDLDSDPAERVRPPRRSPVRKREQGTLTAEELGALVAAVRVLAPERFAEVATLAYTGIRCGELFALGWDDVDAKRRVLHIRHSVADGQLNPTKTTDPRSVPMVDLVGEAILEHRKWLIRTQHPGLEMGICFPSNAGTYRSSSSLTKTLKAAISAAGISQKVTPQILRRTFNTLCILSGADRVVLRAMLGHCNEEMTQRYAGVPMSAKREAVTRLVVEAKPPLLEG